MKENQETLEYGISPVVITFLLLGTFVFLAICTILAIADVQQNPTGVSNE